MNAKKRTLRMTANVILALYLLFLPFLMRFLPDYEVVALSVVLLAGCVSALLMGWKGGRATVTVADVLVFLQLLWACLSSVFVRRCEVDALGAYGWVAMCLLYGACRGMRRAEVFLLYAALALSGAVQGGWALLQKGGWLVEAGAEFPVTGGFGNPGPLGGYLAVAFVASLSCLEQTKKSVGKAVFLIVLLPIGAALVATDSRAAWLSVLMASACWGWKVLPVEARSWGKKWYVQLMVAGMFVGMLLGLYHYKKVSADVRLLIWRAGMEMFADAPLWGHGVASFPMKYMDYQGAWLERHPDSRFCVLADNNVQAFNEPLSLACEQGIVGCLLVAGLIAMALSGTRSGFRPVLLALGVFSCFSYPTDSLALKMFFPMLLGTLSCRRVWLAFALCRKSAVAVGFCLLWLSAVAAVPVVQHYRTAFRQLEDETAKQCALPYHQKYMSRYAKCLLERGEEETFCRVVGSGSFPFMTSVLCCDLGMAYHRCGEAWRAEKALWRAYWMVPPKILPRFCLFRLYRDLGRKEDAKSMAEEILSLDVRQKGTVYLEARTEVLRYLEETGGGLR